MSIIESRISIGSADFNANRHGMLALLQRVRELEQRARDASAGSPASA
jgi:geranyl-CoA carboxylase beta subunit